MDTYEYDFPENGGQVPQPQPDTYTYRKASPFADSPYVMLHEPEPYTPVRKPRKKRNSSGKLWKRLLTALLVVLLVAGSCGATAFAMDRYWQEKLAVYSSTVNARLAVLQEKINALSDNQSSATVAPGVTADGSLTPAQVYAANVEAVVLITSDSSAGSGFIISKDGYVVSNYHVVEDAQSLQVVMYDGIEYEAQLIGYDSPNDVALLKVDAEDLACVTVGSSDALSVGDQVVAIGNPLGDLTSTLTVGYVSAKDRVVSTDGTATNMLQTDAAINSGNSGGPLFNMYGEVVGITTAKYSGASSSGASIEGIGFAIPINNIIGMIEDLKQYGYVTGAYLGVTVHDVNTVSQALGMPAGAYVVSTEPGCGADAAGVRANDIIVRIGDYSVGSVSDLTRILRNFKAGDTTVITVYRETAEIQLTITLGEKPQP